MTGKKRKKVGFATNDQAKLYYSAYLLSVGRSFSKA